MSELHAAVGLAALDEWPIRRLELLRVANAYRAAFRNPSGALRLHAMPDIDGSYILLECESAWQAREIATELAVHEIGTRFWYGDGLVGHAHFAACRSGPTRVSDDLCRRLVGLPCYVDLTDADIERICTIVFSASVQRTRVA